MIATRTAQDVPAQKAQGQTTLEFVPAPGPRAVHVTGVLHEPHAIRAAMLALAWTGQGPAFRGGRGAASPGVRPLLTVAKDRLLIESLAPDCATLVRLRVDPEGWTPDPGGADGSSPIPMDAGLISQLLRLPTADRVRLVVGRAPSKSMGMRPLHPPLGKEEAPRPWRRSFPALSAAALTARTRIRLHPTDLFSMAEAMASVVVAGARAEIRIELPPACAPIAHFMPGDLRVRLSRSTHTSARKVFVEVPHARRLSVLRDLAMMARSVDVLVGGPAQPSTWTCRLAGASLSLVLGPMRAPRGEAGPWTVFQELEPWACAAQLAVSQALGAGPTFQAIQQRAGLPPEVVRGALLALVLRGRVSGDALDDLWFERQLFAGPPPPTASRIAREAKAGWLLESCAIGLQPLGGGAWRATFNGLETRREVLVSTDADGVIKAGACGCEFAVRHALFRGPCEHLLAAARVAAKSSTRPALGTA